MQRVFAVKAKSSQVRKRTPLTCNGYLVAGSAFLHVYGGQEKFEVTTNKGKNAVLPLHATDIPAEGFEPRPSYAMGWAIGGDGLWFHGGASRLS